jgi:hypothetical protein
LCILVHFCSKSKSVVFKDECGFQFDPSQA